MKSNKQKQPLNCPLNEESWNKFVVIQGFDKFFGTLITSYSMGKLEDTCMNINVQLMNYIHSL